MLEYLTELFGINAKSEIWEGEKMLPLFLRKGRRFSVLSFEDKTCLLVSINDDSFNLLTFQKHAKRIEENAPGPVVLCFEQLTSYQRKVLIENRMPFIVPNNQVYLPFLGTFFKERMKSSNKHVEQLSAMSQQLLLYLMVHHDKQSSNKVSLSKKLNVSAMSITRAAKELAAIDLIFQEKDGRNDFISISDIPGQLYEKAKPFLINPVMKRKIVRNNIQIASFPLAGESALSAQSMLNPPKIQCRAVSRNLFQSMEKIALVDPAWDRINDSCELEIWKYDPQVLSQIGLVDPISLVLSLKDVVDERVEHAVSEFIEGWQW